MKQPVVIIGMGEMGGVFSRGFLCSGHPVYPITKESDTLQSISDIPEPVFALFAVGENDLHQAISSIPDPWRNTVGFLQNELLPYVWQNENIENPTVMAVWFEKKKGQDVKNLIPTTVYGPNSELIFNALSAIAIPCKIMNSSGDMAIELVKKNLFILAINITGLAVGGTTGELLSDHQEITQKIASEVLDIQEWLIGEKVPRKKLIDSVIEVFSIDPDHNCMGRSAPVRLERILAHAKRGGISLPELTRIWEDTSKTG